MLPEIRNILFAAGLGHDTRYVLEYALSQAQKYGAKIHVVHSHEALNIPDQGQAEIFMLQEGVTVNFDETPLDTEEKVTAYLEEICQKVLAKYSADPEVIANIRISSYAPKATILAAANDFKADLIVMGSHRHSVASDALLGSTTMKILHSAKVPVLVVRLPEVLPAE
jgi:nucleotide-binding universal stress UspA family protein